MENQEYKHTKKSKKKRWLLLLLILLLLLLIGSCSVSIWALFFRDATPTLAPDYAPQQLEPNAESTNESEDTEKLESEEGGGAVTINYTPDVMIDLSDGKLYGEFSNPMRSNQDMVVQLVIQDTVLLQSGLIPPGNKTTQLDLNDSAAKLLTEGMYDGKYVVYYYEPETGEKAVLNSELVLTIKVQE